MMETYTSHVIKLPIIKRLNLMHKLWNKVSTDVEQRAKFVEKPREAAQKPGLTGSCCGAVGDCKYNARVARPWLDTATPRAVQSRCAGTANNASYILEHCAAGGRRCVDRIPRLGSPLLLRASRGDRTVSRLAARLAQTDAVILAHRVHLHRSQLYVHLHRSWWGPRLKTGPL